MKMGARMSQDDAVSVNDNNTDALYDREEIFFSIKDKIGLVDSLKAKVVSLETEFETIKVEAKNEVAIIKAENMLKTLVEDLAPDASVLYDLLEDFSSATGLVDAPIETFDRIVRRTTQRWYNLRTACENFIIARRKVKKNDSPV